MQEWTSSLPPDKYEVSLADTYLKIITKILTDIPAAYMGSQIPVSLHVLTDTDILDWSLDQR